MCAAGVSVLPNAGRADEEVAQLSTRVVPARVLRVEVVVAQVAHEVVLLAHVALPPDVLSFLPLILTEKLDWVLIAAGHFGTRLMLTSGSLRTSFPESTLNAEVVVTRNFVTSEVAITGSDGSTTLVAVGVLSRDKYSVYVQFSRKRLSLED